MNSSRRSAPISISRKKNSLNLSNLENFTYDYEKFLCNTPTYGSPINSISSEINSRQFNSEMDISSGKKDNKKKYIIEKKLYSNNKDYPNIPNNSSPPTNEDNIQKLYMKIYANMYLSDSMNEYL